MSIGRIIKLLVLALCVISCQASHEFSVNVGDDNRSISQSKNFEFKRIVALGGGESKESIIRKVDRVLLLNDRIVVSDVVGNHVLLFDSEGNFLASTDAMIGKGNNEYVHVQDCAIDTERQLIYMYCDRPYQFYVFDSNLKLLSCIKVKDYISELAMDEKYLYAYCVKDGNTSYELRMYDKTKLDGSYKILLKYNEGIRGVRGMGRVLCGSDEYISFAMPFSNVIYRIGRGEVKNSLSIDFANGWFTYSDSKKLSGRSFLSSNNGKKWIIQNIHSSDSIMFFNTNDAPFCMVNMKNGSGDSYKYFTETYLPYSVSWFTPCSSKQGWVMMEMSVEAVRDYIKYIKEKNKEMVDAIKQLNIVDSTTNPILLFMQFRR